MLLLLIAFGPFISPDPKQVVALAEVQVTMALDPTEIFGDEMETFTTGDGVDGVAPTLEGEPPPPPPHPASNMGRTVEIKKNLFMKNSRFVNSVST